MYLCLLQNVCDELLKLSEVELNVLKSQLKRRNPHVDKLLLFHHQLKISQ